MKNLLIKLAAIIIILCGVSHIQLEAKSWDPTTKKGWKEVGGALGAPKKGAEGFICDSNDDCDSHACVASRCHSKLKKGDDCDNNGQCQDGLYCDQNTCASQGNVGAQCNSSAACKSGQCSMSASFHLRCQQNN